MRLCEAIELFKDHQKDNAKEKTQKSYSYLFRNLETLLDDGVLEAMSPQDLYQFLVILTEGGQSLQRFPSLEDLSSSQGQTAGDHRQGGSR